MRISIIFRICIVAIAVCATSYAQIPNAGFENWTAGNPDGWVTSNINGIVINVTRSSVPHSGTYALQGQVVPFFTSLLAPIIQVGPDARGFGYNQRPASVTGWYQFSPVQGDRFAVNVVLYYGGVDGIAVATAAQAISAAAPSYVQFNAPFVYHTTDTPDTAVLQFSIIGPVTGTDYHLNSTFVLDDLAFAGSAGVSTAEDENPSTFALQQNYPNPFNPTTTISYQLPKQTHVKLGVVDMLGREVATLVDRLEGPGVKSVTLDASTLASGMYFYTLQAGDFVQTKKLMVVK